MRWLSTPGWSVLKVWCTLVRAVAPGADVATRCSGGGRSAVWVTPCMDLLDGSVALHPPRRRFIQMMCVTCSCVGSPPRRGRRPGCGRQVREKQTRPR